MRTQMVKLCHHDLVRSFSLIMMISSSAAQFDNIWYFRVLDALQQISENIMGSKNLNG